MSLDRITVNGVEYVRADQSAPAPKRVPQPRLVERRCLWCKRTFLARAVDVKRGWAKFCSKSCKASQQEKRTGQYRNHQERDGHESGEFADAHLFSNEEHDCNKD